VSVLRGIEQRIESLVEGIFGRAFRSHVQPVELARKLVKEMDDHRSVSVSRTYAPNEYAVYLAPRDREQFRAYESSLLVELGDYLAEHARREGYVLLSAPKVTMHEDSDLAVGEFGIATRLVQPPAGTRPASLEPSDVPSAPAERGDTRVLQAPEPPLPPPTPAPKATPVVMLDGVSYPLARDVTTIGRAKDCDIAIDDSSVSRRHAELRVDGDAVWIVDLDSTNGTEVNGRPIERARLEHGDRVVLGQTEARFERR
jgi:Protein of unknown function (DUF3662)/FHA domain